MPDLSMADAIRAQMCDERQPAKQWDEAAWAMYVGLVREFSNNLMLESENASRTGRVVLSDVTEGLGTNLVLTLKEYADGIDGERA